MSHTTMLDLSRWQWALTAAFHVTFPAITVGTSILLIVCYAMYMRTDDQAWLTMFRFWRQIFGIGFAIGVVSGIVLTFEFGLNWGRFAHDVGPIIGVMIAMEVGWAFFLEAGFLGLLVYGEGRIGRRMMMFATCMVSLGTVLSVTWIMVANSWMQTPAGYKRVHGQFQPINWVDVIFNPSFGIRFAHMLLAALIAAGFFIAGISSWYFLKRRHLPLARRGLSIALGVLAVLVPLQGYVGSEQVTTYVLKYKPAEALAIAGLWKPSTGYSLIEIPRQNGPKNIWQLTIPWYGSEVAGDLSGNTPTPPLSLVPNKLRPKVLPIFYGFRVMFFGWLLMLLAVIVGVFLRLRGRLYDSRWFHRLLLAMTPLGIFAIWGGWVTAEEGRQPWIVNGQLPTAAAVSPLHAWSVLTSFTVLVAIYLTLLGTYVWYVARAVRQGPGDSVLGDSETTAIRSQALAEAAPAS
ncbi:MAG TPA: cytochrome ubiquinol oxidase subunit I [Solirubrobacteraceae bacterium]|nr:cytochrome ubiquinol oxidase subunit I [Solirubrobacteraceae bacterium]